MSFSYTESYQVLAKKTADEVYFAHGQRNAASTNQQPPSMIIPITLTHKTDPPQTLQFFWGNHVDL